jgi:hypothetical protein
MRSNRQKDYALPQSIYMGYGSEAIAKIYLPEKGKISCITKTMMTVLFIQGV